MKILLFPKIPILYARWGKGVVHAIKWAVTRRYMSLESLEPMSNDPIISLPAVAA